MDTIKPEEIVAILKKNGTEITLEQAAKVLEFMLLLANLTMDQYQEK